MAEDCDDVGAVLFESVVVDQGFVVDGIEVPCEDFEASLPLYKDDFRSRSALTDGSGFPALGRIIEDFFVIEDGEVTMLVMDFPSAALSTEPTPDAGAPDLEDAGTPDLEDGGAPDLADGGGDAGTP